jgi:hypothetical protein
MTLNEKILIMYPDLVGIECSYRNPDRPYIIQDDSDGKGPYIKEWHDPRPQPTQQQLDEIE